MTEYQIAYNEYNSPYRKGSAGNRLKNVESTSFYSQTPISQVIYNNAQFHWLIPLLGTWLRLFPDRIAACMDAP